LPMSSMRKRLLTANDQLNADTTICTDTWMAPREKCPVSI
jgi:hypothetical protein